MAKNKYAMVYRGILPQKQPKNNRSYRPLNRPLKQRRRAQPTRHSAQQRAELATRLYDLSLALSKALTSVQVAGVVVQHGLSTLNAGAGLVTLLNEDRDTLHIISSMGYPPAQMEPGSVFPLTTPTPLADAVRLGQPILLSAPAEIQARYPHLSAPLMAGFRAWAVIPLIVEDRAMGAIGLSFAQSRNFGAEALEFMQTLAGQYAQALERARLYEAEAWARDEAEVARLHLAVLAEAGKRLALSLDEEATLTQLQEMIVPAFADQCFIDLLIEAKTIRRVMVAGAGPLLARVKHAHELRYPVDPHYPNHPVLQVIRTGEAQLMPQITETLLPAFAYDTAQLDLIRQLRPESGMIVPLTAQGCTFGAVSFIWAGSGRRYDHADLILARDLANRAALALNNAHLYRQALTEIAERKRAEDEIQSLTRFPGENPNPVLRLSQDGVILYANRASQTWLETWHGQTGSPAPAVWHEVTSRALETGMVEEFEVDIGPKVFAFIGSPFPASGYVNFYGHEITTRKQTEEALRESEQRYRSLFQNNHSIMLLIEPETGSIIDANPAACAFYGYTRAHLTRLKITDINQLSREQIFAEMEQAKREQRKQFFFRHRRAGGEICDVEVFSGPIELQGKKLLYSIIHDITERRQAEEALRLSEERFAKAFRMSPDVLIISRQVDGQLLEVNDRWEDLFGYSADEVIGRTSLELNLFVNPADRRQFIDQLHQAGSVRNYELEIRRKSDELRQASLSAEAIIIDNEPCLLTTVRDITERKQAEVALRESEEKFKVLFNLLPTGVSILNEDLKILAINPALERILAISEEGLLGERYKKRTYLRTDGTPMLPEEFPSVRALKEQQMVENVEIGVLPASGDLIWTNVSATPLPFSDWRLAVITSDITEHKQAAAELQRAKNAAEAANRAKSDFLAKMSHELRTPLNAILGYTQIFKRDHTLTPQQQEGIDIMHQSGEHLLHMINDILDVAKVEAGKLELQPAPVSLPHFLKVLTEMVRERADQKGLTFTYHLDPALPGGVYVDEKRLREVLLNLLSNAIKYTKAGLVELQVAAVSRPEENGVAIRFQVNDTGIGIVPEALEEIFTPFYQGGNLASRIEGTGLGLAISRRLVQLLGGNLQVKSAPGQGSTFWFNLVLPPVALEEPILGKAGPTQSIAGFNGGPITILIVDDRPENRRLLRQFLSSLGFIIIEAGNGEQALAAIAATPPNLILMDLVMPGMDGFEVIRQIRQSHPPQTMPIVAVSASLGGNIRELSQTAGADDFLTKPIRLDDLFACLSTRLNLEWRYEHPPGREPDQTTAGQEVIFPAAENLQTLRELAQDGFITGIEQFLAKIGQAGQTYQPFIEHVSRLAGRFEFEEIITWLDQHLARRNN